jgi:hypothetical protein
LHSHFIKVQLSGFTPNTIGIGTVVTAYANGNVFTTVQMPSRGFQSSVDPVLHFGLGLSSKVDSVVARWNNGKKQILYNIKADTTITLYQKEALQNTVYKTQKNKPLFEEDYESIKGNSRHRENEFVDFDVERLLPKMLSTEGPKLATADVNGDGLIDFIMGSATGDTAKIFIQQANGTFIQKPQQAFVKDKYFENVGAAFFDADDDGDADLVIASGGNNAFVNSPYLQPRLYLNNGKGNFSRGEGLPPVLVNASCVTILDYNSDGKDDIFIGARNVPGSYGTIPSSILLENKGRGNFADITKTVAPDLLTIGMVTDAKWANIDGDNQKELVVVGDWMPVTILKSKDKKFQKVSTVLHSSGWWNCLTVSDINGDGKPDLIAGNFGLNSNIKADVTHPAKLYISDFDKNGQTECIPVYYKSDGKAYPYFLKGEIQAQIPQLKKNLLLFSSYAGKSIEEVFSKEQLKEAAVLTVEQTQSCVFINDGKGNFTMQPLPVMAQVSPVFGIAVSDLNSDGVDDIFLAGNFFGFKPQTGRLDASYGVTLVGDKRHSFHYLHSNSSGLKIKGEARDVVNMTRKNGEQLVIVSMNNDKLHLFRSAGK